MFSKTPDIDLINASPSEIYNFAWEAGLKQFKEKIEQQEAYKIIVAMNFIDESFRLLADAYDCLFKAFGSYQAALMYDNKSKDSQFEIQKHCIAYCSMTERLVNAYRKLQSADPSIKVAYKTLKDEVFLDQSPYTECIKALRNAIMHGSIIRFSPTSSVTLGSKNNDRKLTESAIYLDVDTNTDYFNAGLRAFIEKNKTATDKIFLNHFKLAKIFYKSYYTKFNYQSRADLDLLYRLKQIDLNVESISMLNMAGQFAGQNSAFKYLSNYFNADEIKRIRSLMPDVEAAAMYAISLRDPLKLTPQYAKENVIKLFKNGLSL